jgi:hypothetical protein
MTNESLVSLQEISRSSNLEKLLLHTLASDLLVQDHSIEFRGIKNPEALNVDDSMAINIPYSEVSEIVCVDDESKPSIFS